MNWRNIHIQNPYVPTPGSQQPQRRYTPTRRTSANNSINGQLSINDTTIHAQPQPQVQSPANSVEKVRKNSGTPAKQQLNTSSLSRQGSSKQVFTYNVRKKDSTKKPKNPFHLRTYLVTEQWIINLKKELNKIVKFAHEMCSMTKREMFQMNKIMKGEIEKLKGEMLGKMKDLVRLVGQPELNGILLKDQAIQSKNEMELGTQVTPVIPMLQKLSEISSPTISNNPETKLLLKPSILKQSFNLNMIDDQSLDTPLPKIPKQIIKIEETNIVKEEDQFPAKNISNINTIQDTVKKTALKSYNSHGNSIEERKMEIKASRNLNSKEKQRDRSPIRKRNTLDNKTAVEDTLRKDSLKPTKQTQKSSQCPDLQIKLFTERTNKDNTYNKKSRTDRPGPQKTPLTTAKKFKSSQQQIHNINNNNDINSIANKRPQIVQTIHNMNHAIDKMKRMLQNLV